jgi:hypothetical protein
MLPPALLLDQLRPPILRRSHFGHTIVHSKVARRTLPSRSQLSDRTGTCQGGMDLLPLPLHHHRRRHDHDHRRGRRRQLEQVRGQR